ncbi:cyanophycinase [Luteimonas sp. RIT-PG2_3]
MSIASRWSHRLVGQCLLAAMLLGGVAHAWATDVATQQDAGYVYYKIGDLSAKRPGATSPGLMLVGGGDWPREAFRWWVGQAGNGHLVILRASGAENAQEEFFNDIGGIVSAQTLVFHDRAAASDPKVLEIVAAADGVFIAGGDQSRYIRFWKGTPLQDALNAHVRAGKPLAGTSAGLAIMGAYSYGALDGGSLTTAKALRDPLGPAVTLEHDFLALPGLERVVTDSHFSERDRLGRLLVFLNRLEADQGRRDLIGVGVDEDTALCVGADGVGRVITDNDGQVWLVRQPPQPAVLARRRPLQAEGMSAVVMGPGSRLDLKTWQVQAPDRELLVHVRRGRVVEAPAASAVGGL